MRISIRQPRFTFCFAAAALFSILGISSARAQFEEPENVGGPRLDKTAVQRIKIGMTITATGGPCRTICGTAPIPMDWPEQKVTIEKEDVSPYVKKIEYRTVGGTARQMVVNIPNLPSGEKATATVTFQVTRRTLLPPEDKYKYKIPTADQVKTMGVYLAPSPFIESRNDKILSLAKEVTEGKENWAKVEALYDAVQKRLTYKEDLMQKGALKALNDRTGHCEEFSDLFIALARSVGIPARTVWVPGHCYSEFYLVDDKGKGFWFPCQSSGDRAFGGIPETRIVLQKGDNFHDPDRPKDKLHYLSEFLKASGAKGAGKPTVHFIREDVKDQ